MSVGVIVGAFLGLVFGFLIGATPAIALYSTVRSTTFEGLGFGLAAVLGLAGMILYLGGRGLALLACALALAVGTAVGVTARPAVASGTSNTSGNVTLKIHAAGILAVVPVTCGITSASDEVSGWSDAPIAHVDGRDVTVRIWISRNSGATLSLMLNGVPDSSPLVSARECTWSISSWSQSSGGRAIVLADMPVPTPVPVPNAPPMRASGVQLADNLAHGQFRFTGMRAVSADQPIGTWPLVLDGTVSWTCGQ